MVYLIGAGPGDRDLMTVAGVKALQASTVVVYDALVSDDVLSLLPEQALRIHVGKRGGAPSFDQDKINDLLITLAQKGHIVSRLKGGDPLVFGRAGEEMMALVHAGVPFRLIPGVSSALAAPAAAQIPLTYRNRAASFAVVTAHRKDGADALNWTALAAIDTLVILMGAAQASSIADELMLHGRSYSTPAAAIESATLPNEKVIYSSLGALAANIQLHGLGSPMVIVVGDVVDIGRELASMFQAPQANHT